MDSSFFQEIRFLVSDLFLTFERLFCYESFFSKYGQFVAILAFTTLGFEIITLFTTSAVAGLVYGGVQRMTQNNKASLVVSTSMKVYGYALMIISIIGFVLFAEKTQAYGVFE
jgi:hypothetical protein